MPGFRGCSCPSLSLNVALEEESGGTARPNDTDWPQHAAASVSERRHSNAALHGIDLHSHPHVWLSPGIDVDTSGMSARHEPARLRCQTHRGNRDPLAIGMAESLSRRGEAEP
jgi:hypothetical protein